MVKAYVCSRGSIVDIFFEIENILVKFQNHRVTIIHPTWTYKNYPEIDVPDAFYKQVLQMSNAKINLDNELKDFASIYSGIINEIGRQ